MAAGRRSVRDFSIPNAPRRRTSRAHAGTPGAALGRTIFELRRITKKPKPAAASFGFLPSRQRREAGL